MNKMNLAANFEFRDLYDLESLKRLDQLFLQYLKQKDDDLYDNLISARRNYNGWNSDLSKLIINIAPLLEVFIAEFFNINSSLEEAKSLYKGYNAIYECKRQFIQRNILKGKRELNRSIEEIEKDLANIISKNIAQYKPEIFEQIFAEHVLLWQNEKAVDKLNIAGEYALWACISKEGKLKHKSGTLFKEVEKIDFANLISLQIKFENALKTYNLPEDEIHERNGFKLTDRGCNVNFAVDQANYCIHCHNQGKDSCSKGLNENLKGCPLDEKISEMNYLKSKANIIGSLAVAVIDNPMLAATGHRICNDCMKSCIYQKQKPVDIPQVETRVLKDVLDLPWGFEIYSLLTRWNPLNIENYLFREDNGAKVLVAGMGPAGFTLAHYLLNQGHIVVGIDGLKIEPIAEEIINNPIENIEEYFKDLDERIVSGFGGVMEYGITNRWNKNFLLLIRLLLERRKNFKLFSGTRLGSNITIKQAFELGFQHIALALGAGSPRLIDIENSVARGVRTASDFLMSLQLGSAYKQDSLTNLQLRMPVVVIGGGLTALDAATESIAYYPKLVEKFANNYSGQKFAEEEAIIAQEFLDHHKLFKDAASSPLDIVKELGGVKIVYRNKIEKAPSYRMNHQELKLGLSEGVEFVEEFIPTKIILDEYQHVKALEGKQIIEGEEKLVTINARTILLAAGTVPNVIIAQEDPDYITKENGYFRIQENQFITYNDGKNSISFLGDLHPKFAGNVVKAMASSKNAYKVISSMLKEDVIDRNFFANLEDLLIPVLKQVNRLTDNIVELVIRSPLSAKNFKPGQFFRLQNYASKDLPLMEPIALTGAKVEGDLISTIVLEMGKTSNLCAKLKMDEKLVLMGPTGTATEIVKNKKVMLIGGGLGNAVLFSIGQALKENNSQVIYFAGYRKLQDRYKIAEIEKASDKIIWSCDEGKLEVTRIGDESFHGNIIESILLFANNNPEELSSIDHIIVIGSDKMMHAIKKARNDVLNPYLKKCHAIASINSPMQCMMKEICGQCLQRHIDPVSGEESYVFSCNNQDQDLDKVDFYHLEQRLKQNKILEIVI